MTRAESTINLSPRPEDSHLVPGVEKNDAKAGEILDVPRHEGKGVFKGRGGNHTIRGTQGPARQLTHSAQSAPPCRNGLRHRQNTPRKQEPQVALKRGPRSRGSIGVSKGNPP